MRVCVCVCVCECVWVCIGACPLHCGLFSSTRDLYPLRCQQDPPQLVKTKKYFQTPPDLRLIKNHCSRGNVVHHNNLDSDSLKILKWLFTQRGTYWEKHHHWLHLSPPGTSMGLGERGLWGKSGEWTLTSKLLGAGARGVQPGCEIRSSWQ